MVYAGSWRPDVTKPSHSLAAYNALGGNKLADSTVWALSKVLTKDFTDVAPEQIQSQGVEALEAKSSINETWPDGGRGCHALSCFDTKLVTQLACHSMSGTSECAVTSQTRGTER